VIDGARSPASILAGILDGNLVTFMASLLALSAGESLIMRSVLMTEQAKLLK